MVGPMAAWFCTILSVFAVIILSVIALLFKTNSESMMGSVNDPEDGAAVARTVFGAVIVYGLFFLFCGYNVILHQKQDSVSL